VVWLLIHSVITSRSFSSSESCTMYRDDHELMANSVPLLWYLACVAVAIVSTVEPFESS